VSPSSGAESLESADECRETVELEAFQPTALEPRKRRLVHAGQSRKLTLRHACREASIVQPASDDLHPGLDELVRHARAAGGIRDVWARRSSAPAHGFFIHGPMKQGGAHQAVIGECIADHPRTGTATTRLPPDLLRRYSATRKEGGGEIRR